MSDGELLPDYDLSKMRLLKRGPGYNKRSKQAASKTSSLIGGNSRSWQADMSIRSGVRRSPRHAPGGNSRSWQVDMSIKQDFIAFQESIADELSSTQNRVRNLIGGKHWSTDGEHNEAVLRHVLRSRLPESLRVGRGFVCYPSSQNGRSDSSGQLDILITSRNKPTLHRDGELVFVTADAVEAVIEVKTKLRRNSFGKDELELALMRLATQVQQIRSNARYRRKRCWAGMFVYDEGDICHQGLMETIQRSAEGDIDRAIDCIALGTGTFVRFWENGRNEVASGAFLKFSILFFETQC